VIGDESLPDEEVHREAPARRQSAEQSDRVEVLELCARDDGQAGERDRQAGQRIGRTCCLRTKRAHSATHTGARNSMRIASPMGMRAMASK
jgi:hypothetical protein